LRIIKKTGKVDKTYLFVLKIINDKLISFITPAAHSSKAFVCGVPLLRENIDV
jgi:hypothetical protein